jgi:ketosteroid isomerase-like protein
VKSNNGIKIDKGLMKLAAIAASMLVFVLACAIHTKTRVRTKGTSVERELMKLEDEWADAWAKHDVAFFERIEADDYTWTSPTGEVWTKAQDLAFVKSLKSEKHESRFQVIAQIKARVYGDAAVVTGRDVIKETHEGKEISRELSWTDTWVKLGGRWQCVAGHDRR